MATGEFEGSTGKAFMTDYVLSCPASLSRSRRLPFVEHIERRQTDRTLDIL